MSAESNCCGLKLRTGVILIAALDILIALIFISVCSVRLVGNHYNTEDSSLIAYKAVDIVGIILYSLVSFTAIVLILGAVKNLSRALKPWMITKLILIIVGGILQIAYLTFVTAEFHTKVAGFVMPMEAATIIQIGKTGFVVNLVFANKKLFIVLGCYTVYMVTNYYNLLTKPKEEDEETPPQPEPPISVI